MLFLLKRVCAKIKKAYFFKKTVIRCKSFNFIHESACERIFLRGADISDFSQLVPIYEQLNGVSFSISNKKLLEYCSKKLIIVAEKKVNGNKLMVGMNLFYMNPRDFKDQTVHEGFVGVLPDYQGQGIATRMRKHAISHFSKSGFKGISTRISRNNVGSLQSAEKLGFKSIEEYFDPNMGEDRYYLICRFENNRDQ